MNVEQIRAEYERLRNEQQEAFSKWHAAWKLAEAEATNAELWQNAHRLGVTCYFALERMFDFCRIYHAFIRLH